ncbi:uncharacterized protein [Zea mays]|uniref:uncharacterized protein n=1 Tax=Zea mays TaxID=4577 RepID=UPI0004DE91B7|nr:uncharacterized protein LOC103635109 [Zea mays]|eukprot:XP_020398201.1 uncharacterized protein LOC103635109 [Zea mays]
MERLQEEVACSEERDRELSGIRAKTECLEAEATHLRSGRDEAHKDAKRLRGERTRLQQDLREVTPRAEEAESIVRVANTRLEEANSDLRREREMAGDLQKKFSEALDAMKAIQEVPKAAEDEVRKLSIACDGAIATQISFISGAYKPRKKFS